MCGLIGMIARTSGGFLHSDLQAFEQMMVINTVRGKDSVGAFTKFGNGDVRVIKHGSNPFNLISTQEWKDFRQQVINRGKFLIGHNRAATIGKVNTDNSHPFVEDHIILVHNGTLRSQNNLTQRDTPVDSVAIAHALAEEENDPRRVLDRIDGAFALIWYDSKKDKLYAARNEERPLVLIENPRHYVLSSEAWIAAYPMSRNNLEVGNMIAIKENQLYEFGRNGDHVVTEFNNQKPQYGKNNTTVFYPTRRVPVDDPEDDDSVFPQGSSDTPETKALKEQLARKAQEKFQRTGKVTRLERLSMKQHSTGSAATQRIATAPERGTAGHITEMSDEQREEMKQKGITKDNPDFPQGQLVLCKIITMEVMANQRIKWHGTVSSPGLEMVDATGFLPFGIKVSEQEEWFHTKVIGKVQWCTNTTNGGWTIHIKETKKATFIRTHQAEVPLMVWDHAVNHCNCVNCDRQVKPWEVSWTSVKSKGLVGTTSSGKPLNVATLMCPDCIIERMPDGVYKDEFKNKYHGTKAKIALAYKARTEKAKDATGPSTVQDRQPVGPLLGGSTGEVKLLPNSPTIH